MLPDANVTPGIFKRDAFARLASDLERHVGYIDANLVLGGESYTLHHLRDTKLGYSFWSVEVTGKKGEAMDKITQALMSTIGGREESKELGDGKVQIVVTPTSPDVNLSLILKTMNEYASRTQGTTTVSGYRFEGLPRSLARKVQDASLPLQEVTETKS